MHAAHLFYYGTGFDARREQDYMTSHIVSEMKNKHTLKTLLQLRKAENREIMGGGGAEGKEVLQELLQEEEEEEEFATESKETMGPADSTKFSITATPAGIMDQVDRVDRVDGEDQVDHHVNHSGMVITSKSLILLNLIEVVHALLAKEIQ